MIAARRPSGWSARGSGSTGATGGLRRQFGFGGILLLVVLIAGAGGAAMFAFSRSDRLGVQQDRRITDSLATAKAALVGYALGRGVARCSNPADLVQCAQQEEARPGELPCPDTDGDGAENRPCLAGPLLGRLPWRTLGIPEPKDPSGETLWYAVSGAFRDWDSNPNAATAKRINSDTRGNITVRGADGSDLTTDAVAVIISAGGPFGAQNRSPGASAVCTLTNVSMLRSLCSSNFLESITLLTGASVNDGPFIRVTSGARSSTYNDRVTFLTTKELIPQLEMRVGAELKVLLKAYRDNSSCECYPWADTWPYSGGIADIGQNRGRFPTEPFPENWGSGTIPRLPPWLGANDWHNLFWYSVSKQNAAAGCRTCSRDTEMLSLDDNWVSALFFTPGTPSDGLPRVASSSRRDNLALYLADPLNQDGAHTGNCPNVGEIGGDAQSGSRTGQPLCDQYTKPASNAFDRNRVWTLGLGNPAMCAASAQAIMNAAPCGVGFEGQSVNPICSNAVQVLDACPCKAAAAEDGGGTMPQQQQRQSSLRRSGSEAQTVRRRPTVMKPRLAIARRGAFETGFTLLELALTLAIVAVVAGAVLVPFVAQVSARNTTSTERILEDAKESLIGFAAASGRLPCPATTTSNGAEAFHAGPNPVGDAANGRCAVFVGFLPAVTLGFTPIDGEGYAIDAWSTKQNRIRYAVWDGAVPLGGTNTYPFTKKDGMRIATGASMVASDMFFVCSSSTGNNAGTNCGAAVGTVTLTRNAPVVLWSNGPNAATGGLGNDEAQNPSSRGGTADRIFVSRPRTDAGSAGGEFDDIVTWMSVGSLISRMVVAGTLP